MPTATGPSAQSIASPSSPLEDAADADARKSGGLEFAGRGRGFTDSDPTGTAALDPTRRQMRAAVRRAGALILRGEAELQEAGAVIANGYLRLDRAEWIRGWRSVARRSAIGELVATLWPAASGSVYRPRYLQRHYQQKRSVVAHRRAREVP